MVYFRCMSTKIDLDIGTDVILGGFDTVVTRFICVAVLAQCLGNEPAHTSSAADSTPPPPHPPYMPFLFFLSDLPVCSGDAPHSNSQRQV